jgi:hypothetical protein
MAEFVIWGVDTPNGATEETVLLDAPHGERITSHAQAERYCDQLRGFGCTRLRIQEIDLSKPLDFAGIALGRK